MPDLGAHISTFRAISLRDLDPLLARAGMDPDERLSTRAVAEVFPFRTNSYVVENLIDWSATPDDPIYRLTFPQPGMLTAPDLARMRRLLIDDAPAAEVHAAVTEIRARLNPHPGGQVELNEPHLNGQRLPGLQHKYAQTLLVFPRQGQTCHAYCQYCFRWPQFVGEPDLRMATSDVDSMTAYIKHHPEIDNVLLTGGDPLIMSSDTLRRYIEPLVRIDNITAIRIGTKALSYWPARFVTDRDADDLLALFADVGRAGKQLAVMAHFSHPRELAPPVVQAAIDRIRATGATIRCQAPLIRGVNDRVDDWAELWRAVTARGMVPYYMFVERDTGAQHHFAVPLLRGYEIFRDAYAQVSGLARTVRGPVMSATDGKVCLDGTAEIAGERVFVLHYLQARDPDLVGRPFFAQLDPAATWFTDLKPAFGAIDLLPGRR
jgi:KamA family protein